MKQLLREVHKKARSLRRHPLFTDWLADVNVAPEEKLSFAPMAIDFIMGFRDFNRYFVRYPDAVDARQIALNSHAAEDETHAALLLHDWHVLGFDQKLLWTPRDLYWWMTSDATVASRRVNFELISMVHHARDPLLRFVVVECMEAAGNVFFENTVPVADALEKRLGKPLLYFGRHHLHRETGHLQNAQEKMFMDATLSPAQAAQARALVQRVFEIFDFHFSTWARYAADVHEGRWRFDASSESRAQSQLREDAPVDATRYLQLSHPDDLSGTALALAVERKQAFDVLWETPFHRWVRSAWRGDFPRMTRFFLLQWVVDNWTCADYFEFDTRYGAPSTPPERGINRLSTLYASEMKRRYAEWEALELDDYTQWSAGSALEHYWLDEMVEEHRAVFADLRKLTFRFPKALHRYWIMKCFVRFGDALMHSMGHAMRQAHQPEEDFIAFAGHPERMHPDLPPDPEADEAIAEIERAPLSGEDEVAIRTIIAETYAQEAKRSEISARVVDQRRFERFDRRWLERAASGVFPTGAPPAQDEHATAGLVGDARQASRHRSNR